MRSSASNPVGRIPAAHVTGEGRARDTGYLDESSLFDGRAAVSTGRTSLATIRAWGSKRRVKDWRWSTSIRSVRDSGSSIASTSIERGTGSGLHDTFVSDISVESFPRRRLAVGRRQDTCPPPGMPYVPAERDERMNAALRPAGRARRGRARAAGSPSRRAQLLLEPRLEPDENGPRLAGIQDPIAR